MTLKAAAEAALALLDQNPDAWWPHGTETVEALRAAVGQHPAAWRFEHDGRWIYTTRDPRAVFTDIDPEALYL